MSLVVKQEFLDSDVLPADFRGPDDARRGASDVKLSGMNGSDSDRRSLRFHGSGSRKRMKPDWDVVLPGGNLNTLPEGGAGSSIPATGWCGPVVEAVPLSWLPARKPAPCRQFWKAGDYEGDATVQNGSSLVGMDHARIHPKFLHSNATSHKWALGAFAELLDNALDEVYSGATYVKVDMLINNKDGSKMLLVEDDGGGMSPDKMRQCMSLGYSEKSKLANTIGQYGNGFKTSTMRLGADVIVFSRYPGKDGKSPTQSIGLLSYTFLRGTGKEDIVVPIVDYEKVCQNWKALVRSSQSNWTKNLETIVQWSPYPSEADLLQQFNFLKEHGTRIIIYNLWEDDQGELELDFDTDPCDIQLRGVNRDEKNIEMAQKFPNSIHFLTYRHSLRSYASIIYLRLPDCFRMILRGKDVEHHNIVNDMMLRQEITYRPQAGGDGIPKNANMVAVVTIGFVKDAKDHIDVQGFNVYHKNRLIKPFWRVWNAAGSDGRGVIGVLEANFVEPAHDKQGFERTTVLSRLEARLVQMQKSYWSSNCHKIGYAPRHSKKSIEGSSTESLTLQPPSARHRTEALPSSLSGSMGQHQLIDPGKYCSWLNIRQVGGSHLLPLASSEHVENEQSNGDMANRTENGRSQCLTLASSKSGLERSLAQSLYQKCHDSGSFEEAGRSTSLKKRMHMDHKDIQPATGDSDPEVLYNTLRRVDKASTTGDLHGTLPAEGGALILEADHASNQCTRKAQKPQFAAYLQSDDPGNGSEPSLLNKSNEPVFTNSNSDSLKHLEDENHRLNERLKELEEKLLQDFQEPHLERDRIMTLEAQVQEYTQKLQEANKEQECLISIFSEERDRHCKEVETLKKKLKDAYTTIRNLLQKYEVKTEH